MDVQSLRERFADLVVRAGVGLRPGQDVFVRADIGHAEVVRTVVEQAYAAGAGFVEVDWTDGHVRRSGVVHTSAEALSASRPWRLERIAGWERDGVALIILTGDPNPNLMAGLDPVKAAAIPVAEARAQRDVMIGGKVAWTIVAAPNPGWATQVFGEPDVERLWHAVGVAMRLDEPDPVAAWRERARTLGARAEALNALELTSVRYLAEGTDLTVGLLPATRWTGGTVVNSHGVTFLPNIPTEEVFTSPDRHRADGTIRLSRPLVLRGRQVIEGLEVAFRDGQIVEVTATTGAEAVIAELDTDEGARRLGEVSLVDRDSRIARAGVVFHDTLYDENAACHVAWGQSFPFAIEGGPAMSPQERFDHGLNASAVHTDVVIGGTGMTVTGSGPRGTVEIIRDDEWVLPT